MTTVDNELGAVVGDELRANGVEARTSALARRISRQDDRLMASGEGFDDATGDVVLVVVSVRPDSALALAARIELGLRDAIRVDWRMRTNVPDVFAAGDCVETWHRLLQRPTYMPLGTARTIRAASPGRTLWVPTASFKGASAHRWSRSSIWRSRVPGYTRPTPPVKGMTAHDAIGDLGPQVLLPRGRRE